MEGITTQAMVMVLNKLPENDYVPGNLSALAQVALNEGLDFDKLLEMPSKANADKVVEMLSKTDTTLPETEYDAEDNYIVKVDGKTVVTMRQPTGYDQLALRASGGLGETRAMLIARCTGLTLKEVYALKLAIGGLLLRTMGEALGA